jgi:hypothetical protein
VGALAKAPGGFVELAGIAGESADARRKGEQSIDQAIPSLRTETADDRKEREPHDHHRHRRR